MNNRQVDTLVAEKVMGWKWATTAGAGRGVSFLFPPYRYEVIVVNHPALWREGKRGEPDIERRALNDLPIDPVPHYSEDIQSAWQVVEKLKEIGFYSVIWVKPGIVQLYCHNEICTIEEKAITIPLAICLAALQAVGVEIDE